MASKTFEVRLVMTSGKEWYHTLSVESLLREHDRLVLKLDSTGLEAMLEFMNSPYAYMRVHTKSTNRTICHRKSSIESWEVHDA